MPLQESHQSTVEVEGVVYRPSVRSLQRSRFTSPVTLSRSPSPYRIVRRCRSFIARSESRVRTRSFELKVAEVFKQLGSVRKSFQGVQESIQAIGFGDEERKDLLEEWKIIKKTFEKTLDMSLELAVKAKHAVDDFLLFVVPRLRDEEVTIRDKLNLVREYKEGLDERGSVAEQIPSLFKRLSSSIVGFKDKYAAHAKDIVEELDKTLEELEDHMWNLTSGGTAVLGCLAFIVPSRFSSGYGKQISVAKKHSVDLKFGIKKAELSSQDMDFHAGTVENLAKRLESIWSSIHFDINEIQTSLESAASSEFRRDFELTFSERIGALEARYQELQKRLESYVRTRREGPFKFQ
ncbi:hypothetical protein SCHPADRAFT_895062 [Schizopora paradoxa]|uniref:Uncharacterized protein n=1 Tax=Schizopora paradoxa TaxID=27342 RepID=A0A0H2R525_9AGAM|nr:hypothetical protein SCHPADRAFT_895062 [Schizopora paradoxa]